MALRRTIQRITAGLIVLSLFAKGLVAVSDEKSAAAVDEVFSDLAKPGSPGCALGVYRDGKILYAKGYGLADIEQNTAITPQTVFDIGSTSKQFTAASILLLEKQGKLSVNDDVRKYLPELPSYGQKITILQLLNHTSGLRDYLTLMTLAGVNLDGVTTDADALALITRQRALNFAPGSEFLYSNTGFFLLSVIVQRVTGKTLREFAAENIFVPLNMAHTQYRDNHRAVIPDRALAYQQQEDSAGYALDVSYFEQTGDGAVHTSVQDLLSWDENFYSPRLGGKAFLAELQEPARLNDGKILDYAKGLFVRDYRGLRTVSHGGAWGGYRAELLRFPDQHFSVACLCNLANAAPGRRAQQVADIYLGHLMKSRESKPAEPDNQQKKEIVLSGDQLANYSGEYWSEELGVTYRLTAADRRLQIATIVDASGAPRSNTYKADTLRFTSPVDLVVDKTGTSLHFGGDPQVPASSFTLDAGRTKGIAFQRKKVPGS